MIFSLKTTKPASKKREKGKKNKSKKKKILNPPKPKKKNPHLLLKQNSALIQGSMCGFPKKVGMIVNANNLSALQSETAVSSRFLTITSTSGLYREWLDSWHHILQLFSLGKKVFLLKTTFIHRLKSVCYHLIAVLFEYEDSVTQRDVGPCTLWLGGVLSLTAFSSLLVIRWWEKKQSRRF